MGLKLKISCCLAQTIFLLIAKINKFRTRIKMLATQVQISGTLILWGVVQFGTSTEPESSSRLGQKEPSLPITRIGNFKAIPLKIKNKK